MIHADALKALLILSAGTLAACGDPDPSTDIPTEHMYARFVAETGADGTSQVTATFFEKQDWFLYEGVYLAGNDTLEVRTLEHSLLFAGGGNHFEGSLISGLLEGTEFRFDLQRGRADFRDAPDSWGTLPAPMDLVLPEPGTVYSIENDLVTVAWSDAGTLDDMWIAVDVHCVQPQENAWVDWQWEVDVPGDPGLYTFDASDHMFFNDTCQRFAGALKLYRGRAGALDDAYKPDETACEGNSSADCAERGYVSIRQVRSVPIELTP